MAIGDKIEKPSHKLRQRYLRIGILILVVAIVAILVAFRDQFKVTGQVGYPAIALLNLVASASIFIPVPGVAASCAGGWLLSPWLVAAVSAVPGSVGELTGYAAGFGSSGLAEKSRWYGRIMNWMRRRGWLALFVLSAVPNPVFDAAGVAAGALRFPVWKFLLILCVGKLIKFLIIAYACHYGARGVLRYFQMA